MKRYFIELSFNGKAYHGWQIQQNARTVQAELNQAISTLLQENINVIGCGRTDTGVHAKSFFAHFDSKYAVEKDFQYRLNTILPSDIAVQSVQEMSETAHARFSAVSRTYKYSIIQKKDPFNSDYAWLFTPKLNIGLMNKVSKTLLEFDDFSSFCKSNDQKHGNKCILYEAEWTQSDHWIIFKIKANRFIRNMVRALTGTILLVGLEKINSNEFIRIIESKDRKAAGKSLPAHGLCLIDVEYPVNIFL